MGKRDFQVDIIAKKALQSSRSGQVKVMSLSIRLSGIFVVRMVFFINYLLLEHLNRIVLPKGKIGLSRKS